MALGTLQLLCIHSFLRHTNVFGTLDESITISLGQWNRRSICFNLSENSNHICICTHNKTISIIKRKATSDQCQKPILFPQFWQHYPIAKQSGKNIQSDIITVENIWSSQISDVERICLFSKYDLQFCCQEKHILMLCNSHNLIAGSKLYIYPSSVLLWTVRHSPICKTAGWVAMATGRACLLPACYITKLYGLSFLQWEICSFPRLAICPLPQTMCPFIFKRCLGGGGGDEKLVMFAMVIAQLPPSLCSSCWSLDTYAYLFLSLTHGQICPKTIPLGSRDTRCQYTFGHTVKFTLRTQFCK